MRSAEDVGGGLFFAGHNDFVGRIYEMEQEGYIIGDAIESALASAQ